MTERLEEDEVNLIPLTDSLGREQKTTIINESGLYNVKADCGKEQCALYVYNHTTETGACAFVAIAENTGGIDNGANGIWTELRNRY